MENNILRQKRIPKLPKELREKYKQAGQWPPPEGIIILLDEAASPNAVEILLKKLARIATPEQKKYISRAQELLKQEM